MFHSTNIPRVLNQVKTNFHLFSWTRERNFLWSIPSVCWFVCSFLLSCFAFLLLNFCEGWRGGGFRSEYFFSLKDAVNIGKIFFNSIESFGWRQSCKCGETVLRREYLIYPVLYLSYICASQLFPSLNLLRAVFIPLELPSPVRLSLLLSRSSQFRSD